MRYLPSILLALSLLALSSCEEILDPEGLPYEEKLVIHGILYADVPDNTIQISRTLPLNVPFDSNQAYLTNAIGTVSDGVTSYPLEYLGYSGKYHVKGLTPKSGDNYSLSVRWNGYSAQGSTTIPFGTTTDTVYISESTSSWDYNQYIVSCKLSIPDNCSAFIDVHLLGVSAVKDYRLYSYQDSKDDGFVYSKTSMYKDDDSDIAAVSVMHHTLAPGYYDYYLSRSSTGDEGLGNPSLVKWNVSGDAIGIFFGCKRTTSSIRIK